MHAASLIDKLPPRIPDPAECEARDAVSCGEDSPPSLGHHRFGNNEGQWPLCCMGRKRHRLVTCYACDYDDSIAPTRTADANAMGGYVCRQSVCKPCRLLQVSCGADCYKVADQRVARRQAGETFKDRTFDGIAGNNRAISRSSPARGQILCCAARVSRGGDNGRVLLPKRPLQAY